MGADDHDAPGRPNAPEVLRLKMVSNADLREGAAARCRTGRAEVIRIPGIGVSRGAAKYNDGARLASSSASASYVVDGLCPCQIQIGGVRRQGQMVRLAIMPPRRNDEASKTSGAARRGRSEGRKHEHDFPQWEFLDGEDGRGIHVEPMPPRPRHGIVDLMADAGSTAASRRG